MKRREAYENAAGNRGAFINAEPSEIVWTKSGTEAINLVADTFGRS
jgi:cysteine desulfurase/selenocysteine lyase